MTKIDRIDDLLKYHFGDFEIEISFENTGYLLAELIVCRFEASDNNCYRAKFQIDYDKVSSIKRLCEIFDQVNSKNFVVEFYHKGEIERFTALKPFINKLNLLISNLYHKFPRSLDLSCPDDMIISFRNY